MTSARVTKRLSINRRAPDDMATQHIHSVIGQVMDIAEERGLEFDFIDITVSITDKRWLEHLFQTEEKKENEMDKESKR